MTVTHTAGVLLLGVPVSAGTAFAPARLYPWLALVSGLLVLAVGLTLLRSARHPHTHAPDGSHIHGHGHDHPHPHPHDHGHDTARPPATHHPHDHPHPITSRPATAAQQSPHWSAPGPSPRRPATPIMEFRRTATTASRPAPSRRSLVAMGLAGGLVPSPSALIVFLAATGLGHPWFGVALVVAFGVGMATTLAVVGLLVVRLRDRAEARLRRRRRAPASRRCSGSPRC